MYEDRIKRIEHKGKRIFSLDYSNMSAEKLPDMFEEIKKAIVNEPPKSVLCLVCLDNLHFSTKTLSLFNKLTEEIKPYDKATAVLGVKGLIKVMYDGYSKLAKQQVKTFENKNEALDWLASL